MKIKRNLLIIIGITIVNILILIVPFDSLLKSIGISTFQGEFKFKILNHIIIITLAIFAIKKFNLLELSGLDKQFKWTNKYLFIFPIYLILIELIKINELDFSSISLTSILMILISTMAVGFAEEFVFRGLLIPIMLKKYATKKNGILLSIMIPAIIFGFLHLLNQKLAYLYVGIGQMLYATFLGVFFGALLYRTNKLVPIAILHGLIDFCAILVSTNNIPHAKEAPDMIAGLVSSIFVLPLFIVGLVMIKKIKKEDVLKKLALSNKNQSH